MRALLSWSLAAALAAAAVPARAASGGAGTSSADFLSIGLGARASSMGNTFVGIADDASAIYWNPAGLSQLVQQEAGFLHSQLFNGINYDYLMYAHPTTSHGTWGASLAMLRKSGIRSYDETGRALGNVSAQDIAATFAWGRSLFAEEFSLGVGVKWIKESLAGYGASSYAADLGAQYTLYQGPRFKASAGASLRNLGSAGAFVSEKGTLPRAAAVGFGLRSLDERMSVGADATVPKEGGVKPSVGGEYWVHPMLAARGGLKLGQDVGTGFSAGLGFRVNSFQFDYSFSDFGGLGFIHRGGLTFRFGGQLENIYRQGIEFMQKGSYAEAFLKFNRILNYRPSDRRVIARMKECQTHIDEEMKTLQPVPAAKP